MVNVVSEPGYITARNGEFDCSHTSQISCDCVLDAVVVLISDQYIFQKIYKSFFWGDTPHIPPHICV